MWIMLIMQIGYLQLVVRVGGKIVTNMYVMLII